VEKTTFYVKKPKKNRKTLMLPGGIE